MLPIIQIIANGDTFIAIVNSQLSILLFLQLT